MPASTQTALHWAPFFIKSNDTEREKRLLTVEVVAATRQLVKINVRMDVHLARVNLHNASACLLVWGGEFDFTIKTARTQQGRIKNINAIGGGDYFDVVVGLKKTLK